MALQRKIYIFTGYYGSGKTETAINFAYKLKELHMREDPSFQRKIAVIDMDIVNPFFRTEDAREQLERDGFKVESTLFANTNVDVPALTGVMGGLINDNDYDLIIDVGGDDLGAKAIGRYCEDIQKSQYEQYFVINTRRPFTDEFDSASKIFDDIMTVSGLKTTALINNTNIMEYTTPDVLFKDVDTILKLGEEKNIPVAYYSIEESLIPQVLARPEAERFGITKENIIPIKRMVRRLF